MYELIARYKQGLEGAIRVTTSCYDIDVVFEGTRAYTDKRTIVLPNVDVFALYDEITDEAVEDARAYFMALRGYAWHEAGTIVETNAALVEKFQVSAGSFADMIRATLDDVRVDHRFGKRGPGIAEAMEYTREQWVWPRFVRKKQESGARSLFAEAVYGLQVMMKHYEARHDHVLWRALEPEVQTFVERSIDDLDSAHDTLKMDAVPGTERLCDVTVHMLKRWDDEWKAVAPLLSRRAARKAVKEAQRLKKERAQSESADEMAALDAPSEAEVIGDLVTSEGVPPLLLVTYGPKAITLEAIPFADGFVHHVEALPATPEGWEELHPLVDGQTRTLVILPPDPEMEKLLNEALSEYVRSLINMGNAVAARAEEEMQHAERMLDKMPPDDQPYLIYTTANDQYVTTAEAPLQVFKSLQDQTMNYVGLMKKRLQVLLRTQTRRRWRGHQAEGELLDLPDAAVRIATAPKTPHAELRPYEAQLVVIDSTQTLCGLLVDVSGSMRHGAGGYGIHASKLTLARWAALCFAEALALSKFRFGLWAFTSDEDYWHAEMTKYINQLQSSGLSEEAAMARVNRYGRFGATYIETVKGFDEAWLSVQTRLPNMGTKSDANYDADSLQWVGDQMLAQRAKRRVLFVLSDGRPDTSEPAIQVARQQRHLKKVVDSLVARSVEIVGIGICDDSVRLYYPHSVVIHRAEGLPKVVMNEMEFLVLKQRRH